MIEILLALFMTSAPAHAGDTLYLQQGNVAVDDALKNFNWERDRRHRKDLLRGDKKNHLFIVQFRSAITDIDRQDLETLKARVIGYVPDDAYVIEATGVVAQTIRLSSVRVRDVLKYDPDWKISPELSDLDGSTRVQVSTCEGKTFETRVHSAKELDRLAKHEQTLWIAPLAKGDSVDPNDETTDDTQSDLDTHKKHKSWARKIVGRIIESKLINGNEAKAAEDDDETATNSTDVKSGTTAADDDDDAGLSIGNSKGIALGETDTYPLAVRHHGHIRIELEYDDANAAPCADTDMVNEVSITVKDHKGHEHSASGPDAVLDFSGSRGSYDIQVRGENIPSALNGRQAYTLHVSVD